ATARRVAPVLALRSPSNWQLRSADRSACTIATAVGWQPKSPSAQTEFSADFVCENVQIDPCYALLHFGQFEKHAGYLRTSKTTPSPDVADSDRKQGVLS